MSIKSSKPLTIFVGIAKIPVLLNSAFFRRTIREAAQMCVANHPDKRPVSRSIQNSKFLLRQAYQRVMVYLLTMPMEDERTTTGLLSCLDKRKHGPEGSTVPWDAMRDHHRALLPKPRRDVRLKRIEHCDDQCRDLQIEEGIQEFEVSVEFSARLLQINKLPR